MTSATLPSVTINAIRREVTSLMASYSAAVIKCDALASVSILPLFKLVIGIFGWLLCLELAMLSVLIDVPLLVIRSVFGKPRFVLGRSLYNFVIAPFKTATLGEIPAFQIVRIRYLTRIMVMYYIQSSVIRLRRAFVTKYLEIANNSRADQAQIDEADALHNTFDVFDTMLKDPYQIGALAIFAPLLAVLSFVTQKGIFPLFRYLIDQYHDSLKSVPIVGNFLLGTIPQSISPQVMQSGLVAVILVIGYAVWMLVSAWIDKRSIFIALDVIKREKDVLVEVSIKPRREIPLDIIGYFIVLTIFSLIIVMSFNIEIAVIANKGIDSLRKQELMNAWDRNMITYLSFYCGIPAIIGLIAVVYRFRT